MNTLGEDNDVSNLAETDIDEVMADWRRLSVPSLASKILHALVSGDHDMVSARDLRKILYVIKVMLDLKEKLGGDVTLPKLDSILSYKRRRGNKIPQFPTKVVSETSHHRVHEERQRDVAVNLPSSYSMSVPFWPSQSFLKRRSYIHSGWLDFTSFLPRLLPLE